MFLIKEPPQFHLSLSLKTLSHPHQEWTGFWLHPGPKPLLLEQVHRGREPKPLKGWASVGKKEVIRALPDSVLSIACKDSKMPL